MHRGLSAAWAVVLFLIIGSSSARAQNAPAGRGRGASSAAPVAGQTGQTANEKAAREAFEQGRVFYDAGAFDQASASFEEAYRLSGRDQLLYNVYLAYRDANQPAKAAEALRGFLAKVPNIENRAQLESRLAALDAGLQRERQAQAQRAQETGPVAAPVSAPPPPVVVQEPEHKPRSKRFWAGVSLGAVGGAMMLTSIATGVVARNHASQLKDDCPGKVCDPSLKSTADSGKTLAHATDGLLFGGLAVAAGGAALLFLFGGLERDSSAPPPVTASCSFSGCVAQTTLRF